ncbi:uncharacterized protein LOC127865526 [Dreissena polymorpha]|uniref:uncharacterized protein LOC127865526 n=1 Tax=Dreissena polymorpha TaxID=45954 RepID=UPI002263BE25|nr:uncharacterized protein LOC127865526 [Dreissena polymorpha]
MRMTILRVVVFGCIVLELSEGKKHPFCGLRRVCYTNDDCLENRCCVSFLQANGTEQPWAKNTHKLIKKYFKGKCTPYSRKGTGCNQFQLYPADDARLSFDRCQCAKNLYCEDQNVQASEGYVGVCSTRPVECTNVTMCKSDECCVSEYGIVGQNEGPGTCQTLGKPGDRCLLKNGTGRTDKIVPYSCPCMENYYCAEVDVLPAKFGSLGRCVAIKEST